MPDAAVSCDNSFLTLQFRVLEVTILGGIEKLKTGSSWTLWHTLIIPAHGRLRQKGQEFKAILGYLSSSALICAAGDPVPDK